MTTSQPTVAAPVGHRQLLRRRSRRQPAKIVFAVVLVVLFLFPLYWLVDASFLTNTQLAGRPKWLPSGGTLEGYRHALNTQGRNLIVSIIVATSSTVICLSIAAPAAYAMAVYRVRGTRIILLSLLVVQLIPGIVRANAFYRIFGTLDLLNSPWALIIADSTLAMPFAVLVLRPYMMSLPRSVLEAAAIDGAGPIRAFRSIVVPLSRNGLIAAGLFSFLFAWGDFIFATTLNLSAPRWTPVSVGIFNFIGAGVQLTSWNAVMATAVLASLPAALMLVGAQQYLAVGITSGGTKD